MDEGNRRTALMVGAVVLAAGVAIGSYLYWWRLRSVRRVETPLRSVTEVLNDCYLKMRELQQQLAALTEANLKPGSP